MLDEATSALDSESELAVQDALNSVVARSNRTTIVVAHRLSTIRNADSIAFIGGGRVLEQGSHRELMLTRTGRYRSLVEKQEGSKSQQADFHDFDGDSAIPLDPPSAQELGQAGVPTLLSVDVVGLDAEAKKNGPVDAPSSKELAEKSFFPGSGMATDVWSATAFNDAIKAATDLCGLVENKKAEAEPRAAPCSQEPQSMLFPDVDPFIPGNGTDAGTDAATVDRLSSKMSKGIPLTVTKSTSLEWEIMGSESPRDDIPLLRFAGVTFSYPTRPGKLVLDDFNLDIQCGETVALVGPSGGGKSTTMSMIQRFYDPSDGTVEFMGRDLKTLKVSWYRDQIGYVGQEPTLFNTSIASNISFGCPTATRADIEEAARMAHAHDFITQLPGGKCICLSLRLILCFLL